MTDAFDRRSFLKGAAMLSALTALGVPASALAEDAGLSFGEAKPFSFDALTERAKTLASQAFVPPVKPSPEITAQLNYEALGKIKYKTDDALWADGSKPFPVTFFHLGNYFQKRVAI